MHHLTSKLARLVFPLVLAFVIVLQAVQAAQSQSPAQDGFNTNADGLVQASLLQPDGRLLVAGRFGVIRNGTSEDNVGPAFLSRVNADGSADTSFAPGFNAAVTAMALESDGSVIVGGDFTSTGGASHLHLARIHSDGTVDHAFAAGLRHTLGSTLDSKDFRINTIAVQSDGRILVGGFFNRMVAGSSSTTVSNIVRLNKDGSLDTSFGLSANNVVTKILLRPDGSMYVAGGFTSLTKGGASLVRNRMARILSDGSIDTGFDPNFNDRVNTMLVTSDGTILVAGIFSTLQPSTGTSYFTSRFLARINADGSYAKGYHVNVDGEVLSLALQSDGKILIGGYFTQLTYGNPSVTSYQSYFARLNPNGSPDNSFYTGVSYAVTTITVQGDGKLAVGGYFDRVTPSGENFGITAMFMARFYQDGSLDRDFTSARLGAIGFSVPLPEGRILIGGSFVNVAGLTRTYLAILDSKGVVDPNFNPVLDGSVYTASRLSDGRIYIGGAFGSVNGTIQRFAALLKADGTLDTSFKPSLNAPVRAFGVQADGKVVIVGDFTLVGDVTRGYIARLQADGSVDTTYDPRANAIVRTVNILSDGSAVVGGGFTYFQRAGGDEYKTRYFFAKINADGTINDSIQVNLNNEVYAVAPQADGGFYIGGAFSGVGVLGKDGKIAALYGVGHISADGTLDVDFAPYVSGTVTQIQVMTDKRILISGNFTQVVNKVRNYIARINPDATLDNTYDPQPNGQINTISYLSDNNLFAGGNFSLFWPNGTTPAVKASGATVINSDGTISSSFKVEPSESSAGKVNTFTRQEDGRLLVGGVFAGIGGSQSSNLARVFADGHLDMSMNAKLDGAVNAIASWPQKDNIVNTNLPYAWLNADGSNYVVDPRTAEPISGAIYAVAIQSDGKAVIGGNFTLPNHTGFKNLARLNTDGSLDTTFNPQPDASIYAVVVESAGTILIGGQHITVAGGSPSYFSRLNANGTLNDSLAVHPNNSVTTIRPLSDGSVLIGGSFSGIYINNGTGTTTRSYIAKMAKDGSLDTTFSPTPDAQVNSIAVQSDGNLILAGNFTYIASSGSTSYTSRNYLARLKADGTVDTDYNPNPSGTVLSVQLDSADKLYVAGTMQTFKPNGATTAVNRQGLARLNKDGTVDTDFSVNPNDVVNIVTMQSDGTLVVGGSFTVIGNENRKRLARISQAGKVLGSTDLVPNATAAPSCIVNDKTGGIFMGGTFSNSHLEPVMLVGGAFTKAEGTSMPYLARLYIDGAPDKSFATTPNGVVHAVLRLQDGRFLIGGEFTQLNGSEAKYLAMLKADGTRDTSFTTAADGKVLTLAALPDGRLLVGGSFNSIGGVGHARIAMLKTDGTVDLSYAADADGDVTGILATPTRVFVAGSFNRLGTVTSKYFAVTTHDGASVGFPALSLDAPVSAFSVDADGSVTLAGSFTKVGGQDSPSLARISAAGVIQPRILTSTNGAITALLAQDDGKVVLGGGFTKIDGLDRFMMARVTAMTAAQQSLVYSATAKELVWTRTGGLGQIEYATFDFSVNGSEWYPLGSAPASSGKVVLSNIGLPSNISFVYFRARGLLRSTPHGSQGWTQLSSTTYLGNLVQLPTSTSPVFETGGLPGITIPTLASGQTLSFSGLPEGITYDPATNSFVGSAKNAGTYEVTWIVSDGYISTSSKQTWIVISSSSQPAIDPKQRLMNISSRMDLSGTEVGTAGFVVTGTSPKKMLIRAVGPTLADFNISSVMARPRIRLMNSARVLVQEVGAWDSSAGLMAEFVRLGAFPLRNGSADSVLAVTLDPGLYTVMVDDLAAVGGTVIVELYDASNDAAAETQRLTNLSARGPVTGGSHVLVGGFVIANGQTQRVLIRAPGPTLAGLGVTDALSNPVLKVYDASGKAIAGNDNWEQQLMVDPAYQPCVVSQIVAAQASTGAFAFTNLSKDAAILLDLPPGLYSVIVSSPTEVKGTSMVEVYQLQK